MIVCHTTSQKSHLHQLGENYTYNEASAEVSDQIVPLVAIIDANNLVLRQCVLADDSKIEMRQMYLDGEHMLQTPKECESNVLNNRNLVGGRVSNEGSDGLVSVRPVAAITVGTMRRIVISLNLVRKCHG